MSLVSIQVKLDYVIFCMISCTNVDYVYHNKNNIIISATKRARARYLKKFEFTLCYVINIIL